MNKQIYAEACDWFVELRAGDVDPAGRVRFDTWIRSSPEHLRAYLEVTEIWEDAPLVDSERKMTAEDLAREAREVRGGDLIELEGIGNGSSVSRLTRAPLTRPPMRALAATIALVAVATGIFVSFDKRNGSGYRTEVGEQRSIALVDGSTVQLNTRSRVKVRFTDAARTVEVTEGQAMFDVAKDASRPFVVSSGDVEVTVLGTRFDVYRRGEATTITVVEGRVSAKGKAGEAVLLSAGEQITVAAKRVEKPHRANVASVTSWTQRRLIFNAMPLGQVAAELNRYNRRQMIVSSPSAASFKVSGVYSSTDPALLIRFLEAQPDLSVRESEGGIVISDAKTSPAE